ncbi:MAG: CDP-alcohol phosphatidyltransferase family protein [Polyangiaceae bacterium]
MSALAFLLAREHQLAWAIAALAPFVLLVLAYVFRVILKGRYRSERASKDGGSTMLGLPVIEMFYWGVESSGAVLVRLGISASAITWLSLALGLISGVFVAVGALGVAAVFSILSMVGDAFDGHVARATQQASDAGEVLDATVDRVTEWAMLAGYLWLFRSSDGPFAIGFLAMLASFMISYTTAKSEALHASIPRGVLRRGERAVLMASGVLLTPILSTTLGRFIEGEALPLIGAVSVIAVVGNLSWIGRTVALARAVAPATSPSNPPASTTPPVVWVQSKGQ